MVLNKLPEEILEALNKCSQAALKHDIKIYLVGGVVRDLLLNKQTKDIDVCLEYDAIKFAGMLKDTCNIKILQTQNELRTAKIEFNNGVIIDLASTRKETYPQASHLPEITSLNCPLNEDISRRDFTINAIAISLCKNNFGEIIDFLGGVKDINNKKIKILHEKSFIDDPSRIIRALKYSARFDFSLDNNTKSMLNSYLENICENTCYSRIMTEIKLTFSENPQKAIVLFDKWNLEKLFGLKKTNIKINLEEAFNKFNICPDWFCAFASIFIDTPKEKTEQLYGKLNFENWQKKILNDYMTIKELKPTNDRFITYNKFNNKENAALALYYIETGNNDAVIYHNELKNIKVETTGNDLIAMGINPSREFKTILDKVLKEKLNGKLSNKEDEILFIRQLIRNS